ncbi:unnamed protein product [Moneuplotes crassus]|uniref:Uncharacterized protein n=1 Tax=Euplotes crassus TaxID=5936 RepID=A0AAD1UE76_EUPCR|nr:unnamed protein product [Moneuplotes crassus]
MPDKGGKTSSARINLVVSRKEKRESAQKGDFREKKTQMKNKLKSIHSRKGSMILKHNKSEPKDASLLILEG